MRSRLPRLAGIATAVALVLSSLAAAPANAVPGANLIVNVVDTAGQATKAAVILLPVPPDSDSIQLGEDPEHAYSYTLASTYQQMVPPGDYAVIAMTGWGGITCLGVTPCSFAPFVGGPDATSAVLTTGLTVPDSGMKALTITSELPALRGTGNVGQALTVEFPAGFKELQTFMEQFLTMYAGGAVGGLSFKPNVTWMRNGSVIAGATDTSYVPTVQDVGKSLTATTSYNLLLASLMGQTAGGTVPIPGPFTTNGITVRKIATTISLKVPAKIKFGKRPMARITAKAGSTDLSGWTTLKISGAKGQQRVLVRKGFAQVKLPKLKPGKHKVTATFIATNVYVASSATKKVVVQPKKKHKKHKK